jgi:choline monooxygenase
MIDEKHTDWQIGDPEVARTLPSRFFYDPDIFEREAEAIFHSSWHCVCHRSG